MTLEEYINKYGSSYPATQIAFQDFCDIIESKIYFEATLEQDLPIAKLVNYVNAKSNDSVDLNELLNSNVEGMRLFAEYCSESPDYKGDRIPLLSPNLGVDTIKDIRKKLVSYYEKIHNYERQPSLVKDRWAGFKISDDRDVENGLLARRWH